MNEIRIKPNTKIAKLDAESDEKFLEHCFQDNGILEQLKDCSESESIVLGRTGAGKTAALMKIHSTADSSKLLDLEDISLRFIDNSNVISALDELGVNLDLFYKYLWKHILAVELLKLKYPDWDSSKKLSTYLSDLFHDPKNHEKEAIEYLKEWSDKYWVETEQNLKEIIAKFDSDIKGGIGAAGFEVEALKTASTEQKTEVITRAKKIVNDIQISKLSRIIALLDKYIFDDPKQPHYILIDKLDENWTSSNVKYRLIRALIEEIKHFRKVRNAKIIIALRVDLFQITVDKTRDSGFQEDKIQSLIYKIKWDDDSLKELVDSRVNYVFKHQYTNDNVYLKDLLPNPKTELGDPWKYIVRRTFLRPRDVLQLLNHCFEQSTSKVKIGWSAIKSASKEYSTDRLKSLYEEWSDIYPSLKHTVRLLSESDEVFSKDEVNSKFDWQGKLLGIYDELKRYQVNDSLSNQIISFIDSSVQADAEIENNLEFIFDEIISCFYRIGLLGLSEDRPDNFEWSYINSSFKTNLDCSRAKYFRVHKMFHEALHINENYQG